MEFVPCIVFLLGEEKIVISVTLLKFVVPPVEVDVEYHDRPVRQTSEEKPAKKQCA